MTIPDKFETARHISGPHRDTFRPQPSEEFVGELTAIVCEWPMHTSLPPEPFMNSTFSSCVFCKIAGISFA